MNHRTLMTMDEGNQSFTYDGIVDLINKLVKASVLTDFNCMLYRPTHMRIPYRISEKISPVETGGANSSRKNNFSEKPSTWHCPQKLLLQCESIVFPIK